MLNHYIPQYYLAAFSSPDNPRQVWQHDLALGKSLCANVKALAAIRELYSDNIEKWLNDELEKPANPLLDKIRKRHKLTDDEKPIFVRYLWSLMHRVPSGLAQYDERAAQILPDVIAATREILCKRHEIGTTDDPQFANEIAQLEAARIKYEAEIPEEIRKQTLGMYQAPKTQNALLKQRWLYLEAPRGRGFITSDNPVCFNTAIGLGDPQSELAFPISSSICLYLKWDDFSRDRINKVTPDVVDKINNRIAGTATRFLYSANQISCHLKPSQIRLARKRSNSP